MFDSLYPNIIIPKKAQEQSVQLNTGEMIHALPVGVMRNDGSYIPLSPTNQRHPPLTSPYQSGVHPTSATNSWIEPESVSSPQPDPGATSP